MQNTPLKILFICTHNRCRSILSEALTNHLASNDFTAYSAGSAPAGEVHPLSLRYLAERNIPIEELRSQSWDEFEQIAPDIVITVCDSAAKETCPVWFGNTTQLHWGLPDPSKLQGSDAEIKAAFYSVMATIEARIRAMQALNLHDLTPRERVEKLHNLIAKEI
ncbi:arsenate reductase ArsC [Teredinibacter waterburyi]|jgi:protein tyrosine phosphatase|uniref:arsenate reductase ArsC n=1 Tax=Teredinibacter waterburyi TaxID=1500538 RepID=UPI00165F80F9|nr:arsenate reductase ArsC [Teredinibacter waterburyi]